MRQRLWFSHNKYPASTETGKAQAYRVLQMPPFYNGHLFSIVCSRDYCWDLASTTIWSYLSNSAATVWVRI